MASDIRSDESVVLLVVISVLEFPVVLLLWSGLLQEVEFETPMACSSSNVQTSSP